MSFSAGQRLKAADLNKIQPVDYDGAMTGTTQAITTSQVDVAGATVTFSTLTAAKVKVTAFFDVDVATGGASVALGRLVVDGTSQTREAHFAMPTSGTRATVGQTWKLTLSGAGSHTIKLAILKSAAAATANLDAIHTYFTATVSEVI